MVLEALEQWNLEIFSWINAGTNPPFLVRGAAFLSAEILIYLLVLWMIFAWIRSNTGSRVFLLYALVSILLGLALNRAIGLFWYHPRPFEMGIGHTLISHAMESSFPSDHAVVFFSTGLAFLLAKDTRRWGVLITFFGLIMAWSRIYLGVHFPLDMLGSFIVSILSVGTAYRGLLLIERRLEPFITHIYEKTVILLKLPADWFPVTYRRDKKCSNSKA